MTSQDQADRFFAAVDTLRQRDMAVWPGPRRPRNPHSGEPIMSNESMVTHADDRAQFLQNFLEFHHARSLRAIEWDAIVAFLEANPRTAAQPEREDVPRETHNIISSHIPGGWMCADCGMKEPKLSLRECPAALTTPAPAVSRDDQALLADICDNMAEVLKPLPGEE